MAGGTRSAPPPATGGQPAPMQPGPSGGSTGLKVGGWILAVIGALILIVGVTLVVIHLTQRDSDGYYTSSSERVAAPGYAITAEALHIGDLPDVVSDVVGRVRISATSSSGQPLFVGIGPQSAVNRYLAGVARSQVTDINDGTVQYKRHAGRAPAGPPGRERFWNASATGGGQVTTSWKVEGGDWTIVAMNATGAPQVRAVVKVGAKTNVVLWTGLGFLLVGLIAAGAGVAMLVSSRRP
jgi:hypothetical protein